LAAQGFSPCVQPSAFHTGRARHLSFSVYYLPFLISACAWDSHSWLSSANSASHCFNLPFLISIFRFTALLRFRSQSILSFLMEDSDANRCGKEKVDRWDYLHNYFLRCFLFCGERADVLSETLFRNTLAGHGTVAPEPHDA